MADMIMNMALAGLIILGILSILGGHAEGFRTIAGCTFGTDPLLIPPSDNFKQTKSECGLSTNTYESQETLAAKSEMSNYDQVTNNKRYWTTPCNGSTALPEMCGGLYQKRNIVVPGAVASPGWYKGTRINYYDSSASFN